MTEEYDALFLNMDHDEDSVNISESLDEKGNSVPTSSNQWWTTLQFARNAKSAEIVEMLLEHRLRKIRKWGKFVLPDQPRKSRDT